MKVKMIGAIILTFVLLACSKVSTDKESAKDQFNLGSDRDAHGCIGSAGYLWCAKTAQCERPWDLAQKHGFANEKKYVDEFCSSK